MANYRLNITDDVMENDTQETKKKPGFTAFDAKNYLNVKLANNEDKKELRIRLLPIDEETGSPFKTIHMHTIQVPKEISNSGWKSYVCLKHTEDIDHDKYGSKCPFCEMNKTAYENMEKALQEADEDRNDPNVRRWKEISLANKESEVCVVRCIEREAEDDGPKFWKFNVRSDGQDPKNLIKKLWRARKQESIDDAKDENDGELPEDFVPENILDLETGKDLKVTISAVYDKDGKRTKKTSISIVDYGKNKPLSRDEDLVEQWVNDSKKWSDVFTVKPYEYLSIILDGEVPFYDKEKEIWVSKGRSRDEAVKKQVAEDNEAKERIRKAKEKALRYEEDDEDDEYDETPKPKKKPRYEEEDEERPRRHNICSEDTEEDLPY